MRLTPQSMKTFKGECPACGQTITATYDPAEPFTHDFHQEDDGTYTTWIRHTENPKNQKCPTMFTVAHETEDK